MTFTPPNNYNVVVRQNTNKVIVKGYINFAPSAFPLSVHKGGIIAIQPVETVVSVPDGVDTLTISGIIPANAFNICVCWRVLTNISGTLEMNVGNVISPTLYGENALTAAGSIGDQISSPTYPLEPFLNGSTATDIILNFDSYTTDALGSIRFVVSYLQLQSPTS